MNFEKQKDSQEQEGEKNKKTIVIARVGIEDQARDMAAEKILSSKKDLKGFRGFFRRIWKHNLANEYYRQKEICKAKREIQESGNFYAGEKGEAADHEKAMSAIVERFEAEYEAETLLRSGENKKILQESDSKDAKVKNEVQNLIRRFAAGTLSEEQFKIEKNNLFATKLESINDMRGESFEKKEALYADNLLEIAKQVKDSVAHGKGLDALDFDFQIVVANARAGVETQAQYNAVDKITEKIQKTFIGKFLNETTIASAVAISYGIIVKGSTNIAHRAAKFVGPGGMILSGAVGGAVAGVRENKRLKEDRAQHMREMAKGGKKIEGNSPQREKMEENRYETKEASELTTNLHNALEQLQNDPTEAKLHGVLTQLTEISSRITFSEQQKIDLISFSDSKKVEQERVAMYKTAAEAKLYLRKNINKPWASFYQSEQELNNYLQHSKEVKIQNDFLKEKTEKDVIFNKMKNKQVAWAVANGMGIGLGVGLVAQEIGATFGNGKEGIFGQGDGNESVGQDGVRQMTGLGFLKKWIQGELPLDQHKHSGIITSREFVAAHEDLFSKIKRGTWGDNDTSKFDKNELKLHWGGQHGSGIDAKGNFVFNVKHMMPGGSYHNEKNWDPQELMREGKLKMLLSLSRDTQNNVIEVKIDENGNALIDPNSEIGKLAFKTINGHAVFMGKTAEVGAFGGQINGVDRFDVLATHVGRGIGNVNVINDPEKFEGDWPYIIPLVPRNPLEKLVQAEKKQKNLEQSKESQVEKSETEIEQKKKSWESEKMMQVGPTMEETISFNPRKIKREDGSYKENIEYARAASAHTLYKLTQSPDLMYVDLNASSEQEGDKKFNEITRKLWNEFIVHSIMKYNKATKKFELTQSSDHDGEACIKLLELAGFKVNRDNIKFIDPGNTAESGIIFDTSNVHGVLAEEAGKRLIIDHHADNSDNKTSAARFFYETLITLGLLSRTEKLDATIEFITAIDNGGSNNLNDERIIKNFERNMFGLYKLLSVEQIFALINNGQDPALPLPEEYLKSNTHTNPINNKEQTLADYIKFNLAKKIRIAEKQILQMEKEEFVLDTGAENFGRILIDEKIKNEKGKFNPRISSEAGGALRVFSKGYGGYLIWSPEENSFKLYTRKKIDESSLPGGFSQGRNVRGHMWSKNQYDNEPLTVTIDEIFSKLSKGTFTAEEITKREQSVKDAKRESKIVGLEDPEHEIKNFLIEYFSYKEVDSQSVKDQIQNIKTGNITESERKYGNSLMEAFKQQGKRKVDKVINFIHANLVKAIRDFGFISDLNPFSKSKTWAYWDVAKQLYFTKHPKESGKEYVVADPFTNTFKQREIISRHFGWEIYNHKIELLANKQFGDIYLEGRSGKKIKELLEKPENAIHKTLSSSDLAKLGKLILEKIALQKKVENEKVA